MERDSEMSRATIYALCDSRESDPVKRVRYVGQTRIVLAQRLRRHWVTALAGAKEHRAVWMRSVRCAGGDVLIVAIDCVPSADADSAETAHIARYRALGCDLTNRTDGGRGRRSWEVSPETRRKMSESAQRRGAHSPEMYQRVGSILKASAAHQAHMRRMHERNRGVTRTPEQRARISQSLRGEANGQNVLTWAMAALIREKYAAGAVQIHLAREFGCSPATIHGVVHGHRWIQP